MGENRRAASPIKLVGQATELKDLVKYQEDSIVSKTIIDREEGSMTAFAFDKGQGLSEHTAPFDAVVCVIEGEAEVIVSSSKILLKEGEMTLMPANVPHALKAERRFKMILTMIKA